MKNNKKLKRVLVCAVVTAMLLGLCSCSGQYADETLSDVYEYLTKEDITVSETFSNDADGEHAIEVSGEEAEYSNIGVTKTGEADGDEADFYGENSAVFATE